ncbi:PAS domain S-box-containing protein [Hymenobacter gelipurpurascens]|uniref:histidine kinase n=1 Tax=Hymenobacter gelipurpurascens TaxID=89968 RepID=A0A212UCQ6_9BACT|nr:PAS domain-containing protein [Hymenobacter gelipurpurascens]SNC76017.1 PAS domain S-box-containing protein [Hymenobacter gelipurpurascens]
MAADSVDFELLFDVLPTPHLVLRPDLTLLALNEAMCRLLSCERAQVLGYSVFKVLTAGPVTGPTDQAALLDALQRVLETKTLQVLEAQQFTHTVPEGRAFPRYWQMTLRPVLSAEGGLRYILCRCFDVTDQIRLQQQGKFNYESFTLLARATHDIIWDHDLRTNYLWRNELFSTLFGYHIAPENSTVEFWRSCLHPDDLPIMEHQVAELLAGTTNVGNAEYRLRRADGSWAEVADRFYIVRNEKGEPIRMLGAMQDVTQARHTERALHQSLEQFQLLADFVPQLIWTTNAQGEITYMNQRWQEYTDENTPSALHPDELWVQQMHPDDRARAQQRWRHSWLTGEAYECEYRLRSQTGQYRWFLAQALPVRNAAGETEQWFGTCTNVDEQKRTQLVLADKDQQLQYIVGEVPALLATLLGPHHVVGFINHHFNEFLGGGVKQGQTAKTAAPWLDEQGLLQILDDVYTSGEPASVQEQRVQVPAHLGLSQQEFYFDFVCRPLHNEFGGMRGILVFAVDVTERVLARRRVEALDQELHQQDELLRQMLESLPQMTSIIRPDGGIDYASPQWFEYSGQDVDGLSDGWIHCLHPDEVAPSMALFAHAQISQQGYAEQVRLRRHDGQYRWHLNRLVPSVNNQGKLHRWYASSTDIHEQQMLAEELRRSEEQFRFLAETIPAIAWTAQPNGQIDYINTRWSDSTGVSVEQTLREGWGPLLHQDEQEATMTRYQHCMATGENLEMETRLLDVRTGRYRWHLHRAYPLREDSGSITRWFGTTTDIDDYKRVQQHLEERNAELTRTNQDLDNFVYTASHDLMQPINNMEGIFQELTRTAFFRDPDAVKLIAMFEKALHQIYGTIHDLAQLVQVQKQRHELPLEPVELQTLAQEVLTSIGDTLDSTRAIVTLDFAAVPVVPFVRPNLQSVLYNLISNALKYAAPHRRPQVAVSTALENGRPVLLVQDNGLGIDLARYGSEMFQMFRRFHDHVPGSGMGLYLVNRIVQSHGGHISVESHVGQGTTFRVYLPPLEEAIAPH